MGSILHALAPRGHLSTSFIPPPSKFDPERDIPDLSGKIALVTGGNSGLGYETAKQLLLKGAKVYIAARSPGKATESIERLQRETSVPTNRIQFVKLDLADLKSARTGATNFPFRSLLCHNSSPVSFSMGAQTQLWAGTTASGTDINSQYLIPWARVAEPGVASKMSQSVETEKLLVEYMQTELKGF